MKVSGKLDNEKPTKIVINAFVIIPFKEEFNSVWSTIEEAVTELSDESINISVYRASDHKKSDFLSQSVFNHIDQCDIAIIDTTGQNNNVIFEFGYAVAKKKRLVLLTQDDVSTMASDYQSYLFLNYTTEKLNVLKTRLKQTIIREIQEFEKAQELNEKSIVGEDVFPVDCIKDRKAAQLETVFRKAKEEIRILQTNMITVLDNYVEPIKTALDKSPSLEVFFLALDPESYFAAVRAEQIGQDVAEFRNELRVALQRLYDEFKEYSRCEIRTYDDFPTQICFIVDRNIYNCVVSKYQQSRYNCLFKLNSTYPSLHTSFNLHFTSVWRDKNTTKRYIPPDILRQHSSNV